MKVLDETGLEVLKQYLLAELPLINPSDWEQLTSPGTATIYKLKVINNQLVAPAYRQMYATEDGENWTSTAYGSALNDVCYFKGNYIVARTGGAYIGTSLDNLTYSAFYSSTANTCCTDGNIVVVAGNRGGIYYSTDGTNFIQATSPVTNDISASIYNNGLFILVGRSGTILTSEDGLNWVKRTINITTGLNDIFYDGKKYIVVGNSKVILTSNDGITWTNITTNLPSTDIQTIYYQDNYYIITASSNTLYYSKDLTSFTSVSIDKTCYAIVYFKDQLYISGSSGYVARASITDQKLNLQEVANYFMNKMNK